MTAFSAAGTKTLSQRLMSQQITACHSVQIALEHAPALMLADWSMLQAQHDPASRGYVSKWNSKSRQIGSKTVVPMP